jgi:transposase
MVFCVGLKAYTRLSSRRLASALRSAADAGLIGAAPHFNSVTNYLGSDDVATALRDLIAVSALPLSGVERSFAVDSSGFAAGGSGGWNAAKHRRWTDKREWVKAHILVGTETHTVAATEVTVWSANDYPYLSPLLRSAKSQGFDVREISADKAYTGRSNAAVAEQVGARPFILLKANSTLKESDAGTAWERMYHSFAYHREDFFQHYHRRSNVETAFSMIKMKFGELIRSRSFQGRRSEVFAKILCHNICVLIAAMEELGLATDDFGFDTVFRDPAQNVVPFAQKRHD